MSMSLDPQIRTLTRTRTRTRRLSACYRHPSEPVTGFCALCLRDRLACLDPSGHLETSSTTATSSAGGGGGVASTDTSCRTIAPDLRRSKSVSARKCDVLLSSSDPRRKSCDVRARNTLSDLFSIYDKKKGGDVEVKVESKNLGFTSIGIDKNEEKIRVSEDVLMQNDEIEEEEVKTMKEHIDLEWQNRKQTGRVNFWEAASVFSQKLRKWRQKQKAKKYNGGTDRRPVKQFRETQSEVADYGFGRRSCDTEPRFSVDANRMSVDDSRFSFDEHRASWDGYFIARTIPRLTTMLPIVDAIMLGPVHRPDNLQMHSIIEDGVNSGESAQSNSDSSSSHRGSSSDRSSSIKSKTLGIEADDFKSISNAKVSPANDVTFHGTKLVITERELKDWHLNSIKDGNADSDSSGTTSMATTGNVSNAYKRSTTSRWRKVCNLWGYKGNGASENLIDGVEKGDSSAKLVRNSSTVSSRSNRERIGSHHSSRGSGKKSKEEFVLERNRSARYSTSDLDSGLLRFYLTPFRNYSRSKSGKCRVNRK